MTPRMKALVIIAAAALLPLAGCTSKPTASTVNTEALLTGKLPYNPLAWKVVTSWVNERNGTMSTLYGNDVAVQYARSNSAHAYPAGSVLALVTWAQRDDPHWFGAKIPSAPQSVEFVLVPSSPAASSSYQRYQGSPLALSPATGADAARIDYLITQRAAVMP
ncbi:cytochrome P460 family protein [Edaphobacter aggregans]|uniref:cytochrome P460 family protein n=1 Tax=Edaphobacter aggregans TaxID=570835 RepID=UPI0005596FD5|nr:cytochrome P460 family protein [Edaphobacter aggregans]